MLHCYIHMVVKHQIYAASGQPPRECLSSLFLVFTQLHLMHYTHNTSKSEKGTRRQPETCPLAKERKKSRGNEEREGEDREKKREKKRKEKKERKKATTSKPQDM